MKTKKSKADEKRYLLSFVVSMVPGVTYIILTIDFST